MKTRSKRAQHLVQSPIRSMTTASNLHGGINMGQGICDVPTPDAVKRAAVAAIEEDVSIYTRFDGDNELREALARKLLRHNNIQADPETEIVVTCGASGAFACAVTALFDPGDEIILFEPYYGYHLNTARVGGLVPCLYRLNPPELTIDFDRLESLFSAKTRAIVVNTPANPSGKVFTRAELEAIAALCAKYDCLCITDEIYEYIVYPGAEHLSMASLPGMRERTVMMGGYSKTFSITGWRIGFAVAPPALAEAIGLISDLHYICAPAPLQRGVARAVDSLGDDYYADMCASYLAKRDRFCGVLGDIGLDPVVPDGAYYVLADIRRLGEDTAQAAAMRVLIDGGVASIPGSAFFTDEVGEHYVRFCYAKRPEHLDEACERLSAWGRRLTR